MEIHQISEQLAKISQGRDRNSDWRYQISDGNFEISGELTKISQGRLEFATKVLISANIGQARPKPASNPLSPQRSAGRGLGGGAIELMKQVVLRKHLLSPSLSSTSWKRGSRTSVFRCASA